MDIERALAMYAILCSGGDDEELAYISIPGPPPSKARARFSRSGRVYSDPKMVTAETATAWRLKSLRPVGPFTGNVALGCVFFRPNSLRIDTDNMLKHICDAANGILWVDDSQVTAVMATTEMDVENPRTLIVVGRHVSTLLRGSDSEYPCAVCSKSIRPAGTRQARNKIKCCSRECSSVYKGYVSLVEEVVCPQCGKDFRRRTKTQKLCSEDCRTESMRGRNKRVSVPYSKCSDCGVELAHRRGGRCRDCWRRQHISRKAALLNL